MDSKKRRQEKLSRRRELYRLRMARETPKEKEARLIRQYEYSINAVSRPISADHALPTCSASRHAFSGLPLYVLTSF